ncbi:glycosyl transferase family 2 [Cnuella takakiae]|nr:glycosyl transferase family 2 [Cnuella takakiae]
MNQQQQPLVAIVILNWNGRHYLEQFLPSVFASGYPNLEVVVADNASSDDSVLFLRQHYPQVQVLELAQNFGFAKGYNEALKHVAAPYYMLLNSDVAVTPGWLQPMVALLEQQANYVACQPKILAYKNQQKFEYAGAAGGWIDAYGYPFARGRVFDICEVDEGQYSDAQQVFWASGAALLIKREAYHAAGGFDPYFFAHQEEIDLCWRLQRMGKQIWCCPQSVVYHVGGGTLPRGNSRKTFLNFRNNQIMLAKNLAWSELWWKIPYRQALDALSAWKGLLTGDGGYFIAIVKAHIAFVGWLFTGERQRVKGPRKKMRQLTGVFGRNLVWQHFVLGRRRFTDVVQKSNK